MNDDGKNDDLEISPSSYPYKKSSVSGGHNLPRSRRPSNASGGHNLPRSRRPSNASQVSSHSASRHGSGSASRHGSGQGSGHSSVPASRRLSEISIAESVAVAQVEEKAEAIAIQRVKDFGLARGSIMNMIGPKEIKFLHRSYKVIPPPSSSHRFAISYMPLSSL